MPEEEIVPVQRTRAPRKRAVSSAEPKPRAPRRTVARKAPATPRRRVAAVEPATTEPVVTRKAPTPIAAQVSDQKNRRRQLIVAGVVMVFGIGASAAVGFSDAGRIDVNQTIESRNERITSSSDNPGGEVVVPVQSTSNQPNGGMRGRGVGTRNLPPPETAASSTEQVATSTEDVQAESTDTEEVAAESVDTTEVAE